MRSPTLPRNLKITLSYNGARYSGWQIQPGRETIQGTLSEVIGRLTGEKVLPQGSGRTDAGVHALAQVASVQIEAPIPPKNFHVALNRALPPAIRVLRVQEVPPGFHARHSARAKTYEYRIDRRRVLSPFRAGLVCHHPFPLDEALMIAAAAEFTGTHDFTSFAAVDPEKAVTLHTEHAPSPDHRDDDPVGSQPRSNVRTIFTSRLERLEDDLIYTVRGDGFLHHMVRNMVGALLLAGKKTLLPADFPKIIAARSRAANPAATAPAAGLYLVEVEY